MFGFAEVKREPVFAGMTSNRQGDGTGKTKMDPSFRWNDGVVRRRHKCPFNTG
ncbi:hypothetical protein [Lysobacter arvi]|uniref:Uncharacterized protein n=1 Tax=Lysobacter arvi TaxID=3038776 RepID=A0ABU1CDR8_9GAMM|nr:hypothetical protein [Lysobacter arvi]MDR0183344.1 hypothetical protein [Lysobacter arvi]